MEEDTKTLERRVQDSLQSLRGRFQGLESEAQELKSAWHGLQERASFNYQIRSHPLLALGVALAGGLVVGRSVLSARRKARKVQEQSYPKQRPPAIASLRTGFVHSFLRNTGERFGEKALRFLAAQIGAYAAGRFMEREQRPEGEEYSTRFLHRRNGHLWNDRI